MKRKLLILTLTAMLLSVGGALTAFAGHNRTTRDNGIGIKPNLMPVPKKVYKNPKVEVWTRQGEGAVLSPGQSVDVFFRTKRDAYVVVVNIDTRGRARKLFPTGRRDDGFVRGRQTVAIPRRGAPYRLQVTGPAGTERIIAFASDEPLAWRWQELIDDDLYDQSRLHHRRDRSLSWGAEATFSTRNAQVRLAGRGGSAPNVVRTPIRPQLEPVYRPRVFRDETWFSVVTFCRY